MTLTDKEFNELPLYNKLFWIVWSKRKGYPITRNLPMSHILSVALVLGDLRHDTSIERVRSDDQPTTFNNVLDLGEFLLAFDGKEPIESLSYTVNQKLRKRINQSLA